MRVLHCPSTVGGNPQGLSRAERGHGCESESWTLTQNQYQYPADRVICPSGGRPLRALLRWWAIGRMVGQFDPNDGDPQLVRFRITCCAADALRLVTPLSGELDGLAEGEWIEVFGQWDGDTTTPGLDLASWHVVETPDHPYLTIRDA